MKFCAKDPASFNNKYLVSAFGQNCWGSKEDSRSKLLTFDTAEQAIAAGKDAMPSDHLKERVVAEPV